MNKKERAALDTAVSYLDSFLAATRGDESTCSVFRECPGFVEAFSEEQRRQIRIYVETWIWEPLIAVQASLDGDRTYQNQDLLASFQRR